MPAQTGQADGDSDLKWETVSPWMAFFWLTRVRMMTAQLGSLWGGDSIRRRTGILGGD